jgi:hypothetical protein
MADQTNEGGWQYYQVPRSEFYEELGAVLAEFSDLLMEDPKGAQKFDHDPYNDWFYCGYGGNEEAFRVSLWPAYLPVVEAYEEGQLTLKEYRAQCWPASRTEPVTVYLGRADDVIGLAEDETAVHDLAAQMAAEAGIELVDDWDDTPPAEAPSETTDDGR